MCSNFYGETCMVHVDVYESMEYYDSIEFYESSEY